MNLLEKAKKIAALYKENQKVEAVLLGGSVARGWNDQFSDIELFVLWSEAPSDSDRQAVIHATNGSIIDFHPYEDEEWSESYISDSVKLEISSFLTATMSRVIKAVTQKFDTDLDKQCLVATIQACVPLEGELIVKNLKGHVQDYPDALREAMIQKNIDLGNRWNNREALLNREDWHMLYKVMVGVQTNIMGILFGLNRLYVHHPAFKWQKHTIGMMKIIPYHANERMENIFLHHPKDGIAELEAIIEDVYQLIHLEVPNIVLTNAVNRSQFLRPKQQETKEVNDNETI